MSDNALAPARNEKGLFIQGVSGNPSGRPVGARNKLGEAFIQALNDSFEEHGAETIETVRIEKPDQYLKVIASLCPKELNLNINDNLGELSDDELIGQLRALASQLAPLIAVTDSGTEAQGSAAEPSKLH